MGEVGRETLEARVDVASLSFAETLIDLDSLGIKNNK